VRKVLASGVATPFVKIASALAGVFPRQPWRRECQIPDELGFRRSQTKFIVGIACGG